MSNIDNLLTPEQIEDAINGVNISGSVRSGLGQSETFTPASTTPISGYGTDLKPRITGADGEIVIQERVSRPNIDRFNKQAADRELEAIKRAEKATRDHENLDPSKLLASMNAMDRRLRKIEKQLKEQQS